jgi:hypothetical protein
VNNAESQATVPSPRRPQSGSTGSCA